MLHYQPLSLAASRKKSRKHHQATRLHCLLGDKNYSQNISNDIHNHGFNGAISLLARRLARLIVKTAKTLTSKAVLRAVCATAGLFVIQSLYVLVRTPRLPPPDKSGVNFPREGLLVRLQNQDRGNKDKSFTDCAGEGRKQNVKEFRLVLIGDSPVEGIGNSHHNVALGGRTAEAFAKLLCKSERKQSDRRVAADDDAVEEMQFDCVRYWSYGKSGLTARGVNREMVPLLHRVIDDVVSARNGNEAAEENCLGAPIHAIVLLCGVNNVLDPRPTTFYQDVHSLIHSIRHHPKFGSITKDTPLLILGLPDFTKLPFLPSWPMGWILGRRGRYIQHALETVVREVQQEEMIDGGVIKTRMVRIPDLSDVLGTIGHQKYESSRSSIDDTNSDDDDEATENVIRKLQDPFKMTFCHPLLEYLGDMDLDKAKIATLGMQDFLSDDGFHPGRFGTIYCGNLIAAAYRRMKNTLRFNC
ncbi:hypothetical protein ACHAXS_011607 [Conticribra weissflogii]